MDDQREVIAFLGDPANHGAAADKVERIETHASVVFLVGERAYKLKRAVRLPYLDYSTLSRREQYCRAELALNRRTAPELYRRVRSITRGGEGRLAFDGTGPVVEWVLELKRFDQETLFDRLAAAHRLTPELMRDLADAVAAFHAAAEIVPEQGGRGGLAATIAGTTTDLARAEPPFAAATVAELHSAYEARLAGLGDLLERRRREGRVRRCHGDLHLGNICLVDGRPTLFDAIEFSDAFAAIDVLYDFAFLVMDLIHRDLGDLANAVFNRYLDRSGEGDGLAALPLFLSLRAAIRADVRATAARTVAPERRAGAAAEAASYLALAGRLLQAAPPRLIAVGGLSGSGKSSVARGIAANFRPAPGARIIRTDVLRKRLAGVAPETPLAAESYSLAANERVYAALYAEAAATLAAGYTAIADAAFLRAGERERIAGVAAAAGAPFTGLWLEAPAAVLDERIGQRHGDASDADRRVLERQLTLDLGAVDWVRLDSSRDLAATLAAARERLAAQGLDSVSR